MPPTSDGQSRDSATRFRAGHPWGIADEDQGTEADLWILVRPAMLETAEGRPFSKWTTILELKDFVLYFSVTQDLFAVGIFREPDVKRAGSASFWRTARRMRSSHHSQAGCARLQPCGNLCTRRNLCATS
jgi:hypothetical protein